MFSVRIMKEEDLDQVCQIEEESFSMPWSRDAFLEMIHCDWAIYLVVEDENAIIGSCGVRNILGDGEITNVVVKNGYRSQGVGSLLMEQLIEEGKKENITAFTLEVRGSNAAAISLYEKFGFKIEGKRKNFYEKPQEDAIIMWKRN